MEDNIKLSERDTALIGRIAEIGMIKNEDVDGIYKEHLTVLRNARYIRRINGYVILGPNGIKYAEEHGLAIKHPHIPGYALNRKRRKHSNKKEDINEDRS